MANRWAELQQGCRLEGKKYEDQSRRKSQMTPDEQYWKVTAVEGRIPSQRFRRHFLLNKKWYFQKLNLDIVLTFVCHGLFYFFLITFFLIFLFLHFSFQLLKKERKKRKKAPTNLLLCTKSNRLDQPVAIIHLSDLAVWAALLAPVARGESFSIGAIRRRIKRRWSWIERYFIDLQVKFVWS